MPDILIAGRRLDYRWIAATDPTAPTLVFLHEGLGSIGLWRDFPARLAAATGSPALIYSRYGYGRSESLATPRRPSYLHDEALQTLPELLDALAISAPVLIGHSDGASIALIHAGAGRRPVRGVILEAPHVFVEEIALAGIARTAATWRTSGLRDRLARHHDDVEGAFAGWHDTWTSPEFRDWNIESCLPRIACPILAIQGADDEYGTPAQLDAIAARVAGPVEILLLPECGHSPHRDQAEATLDAMARFVRSLRVP